MLAYSLLVLPDPCGFSVTVPIKTFTRNNFILNVWFKSVNVGNSQVGKLQTYCLSNLHSLKIFWIVRKLIVTIFFFFAANWPYSSHSPSQSLLWCQRRKEWTEFQARRANWNNPHHRQSWGEMVGQNSKGVMWVQIFLTSRCHFLSPNEMSKFFQNHS